MPKKSAATEDNDPSPPISLDQLFMPFANNTHLELLTKMIQELMKTLIHPDQQLAENSELSNSEIARIAVLQTIGDFYQLTVIQQFCRQLLRHKISLNRKGREEIVRTLQQTQSALTVVANPFGSPLTDPLMGGIGSVQGEGLVPPLAGGRRHWWTFWRR